ncbi:hypothetical protein QYE76_052423 [Lolium multiflorum]|uniref:Uncharacterized protein n=1 Tax=Lolium multiflorum TaxID=4521 RepID=A0AAD8SUP3_LOLMU|nr:hypothetical protein QYE76_052423 [Lolium multiflorum]
MIGWRGQGWARATLWCRRPFAPPTPPLRLFKDKTLLDTTCSGSFTSNKEEFKRDLLDRIKENAEDWENDKGKESGYADKPPFKPLPPKEGNEEKEKKKKKKGTKKKKKNKKKEVTAYPRVNEITLGNRKYVAPNDYCDNESEYDDLPMPFTYISDHDLNEHTTFDIGNLFGTDYESNDDSIIHVPLNDDIESPKLGDAVLEDPIFETSTFSENDDITYSGLLERDIFDLFLPEFDKPWDETGFRSIKWMTKEHVMEATWEKFAGGLGYELPGNDINYFRIHLQHKTMRKDKMANLYLPGRMMCGSAYDLLPTYDIMNRVYRNTINPKHTKSR